MLGAGSQAAPRAAAMQHAPAQPQRLTVRSAARAGAGQRSRPHFAAHAALPHAALSLCCQTRLHSRHSSSRGCQRRSRGAPLVYAGVGPALEEERADREPQEAAGLEVAAAADDRDAAWTSMQWLAFLGTYLCYSSCYLARNNSAVAKSRIGSQLGLPDTTLGGLDTSFLLMYTLGSFTLSPVTDKLGAWTSIIGGLAGIGAVQTILAFAPITDTWALAALYGCNGLLQSLLYPACKKVMGESFGEGQRGSALGLWNTCYYAGSIASTFLATRMMYSFESYQPVFAAPALVLPAVAMLLVPVSSALRGNTKAGSAGSTAALFDVGSIVGSLAAGKLSDRLGQQAGLAAGMLAPLSVLLFAVPGISTGSSVGWALPVSVFVAGLLIGGPETLQGSVSPLRYASEESRASAVGFVNGWGSAGTVLAAPLIPVVAQMVGGMDHAFALLGPLTTMAGVVCFLQWAVFDAKPKDSTA